MKTIINTILIIICFSYSSISQNSENKYGALGLGAMYNFQTESWGVDARLKIPLIDNLSLVPRFSYYLPGNKINEYYLGADVNYYIPTNDFLDLYILAGGYYNNWINNEQYYFGIDKKNNVVPECGGGVILNIGCRVKWYIEYRYNIKWKEGAVGTGILLTFQRCKSIQRCPAYKTIFMN
jgi:opacity protein-like surface antigen